MNEIGLIVRTEKKYWEIINKVYKRQKANKSPYYQAELAKELGKSRQEISESVKTLRELGIAKVEDKPGPHGGRVNLIYLTDRGVVYYLIFSTPTIDEIKQAIMKIKDYSWDYVDRSELARMVAIEMGKDPESNKSVMALIYAVMAMPDMQTHLKRKLVINVGSK